MRFGGDLCQPTLTSRWHSIITTIIIITTITTPIEASTGPASLWCRPAAGIITIIIITITIITTHIIDTDRSVMV
jgi:hypothetical protein